MSRELVEMDSFAKWSLVSSSEDKLNLLYVSYSTTIIVIKYIML